MSKKYSKRKIESLLLQTSATLSGEADKRIRGNLGIKDMTVPVMSAYGNDIQDTEYSEKSRDRESRIPVILTTSLTIAAVVCAVMLAVWVRSLRKNQNNGGGAGQEGMTPTTVVTDTPAPEMSATPTLTTSPKVIEMPDYRGLDYSVAIAKLQALEMSLNITYEPAPEIYEDYPVEGQVIKQLPDAGEPLREGDSVLLMYSIGDGLFEIGDYREMTAEQVRYALDNKLDVRIDWVESDTVMENYVVDTQPGAGEKIPLGSTITVLLSRGNTKYTEVPNVIGKGEADAKALLVAAKLDYSTEWDYSDTVPAGMVISQSPDATAENVEKGTVVKLVISAGRESGSAPESTPTTAPTATPTTAPTATPTPEPTSTPTIGPDEIRIDEKNFPDPTFREIVARNWDNNQNGALDAEEISGIVYVHVNNYEGHELKSLKGIEYFTELGWLICYKTDITELDVSKNVKLCSLECREGKLMKLDLSANTELTTIDVRSNKLTELDLSANKKLTRLDCSGNKISSLNLSANTELTELLCSSNPLNGLDVTKCKKLTRLTCFACGLETIDLSDNTELTTLNIGENKLTALDLSNNGKLVDVDCYLNSIDTLTFRSCASLQHLSCEENKLTSLDVSGLAGLNYLFCANNQLSELDVSGNPDLAVLTCYSNMIRKLDVSGNTKLEELLCWNCGMSELILGEHSVLVSVDARDNNLTELDASGCPETEDIMVDDDVTLIRTKGGQ